MNKKIIILIGFLVFSLIFASLVLATNPKGKGDEAPFKNENKERNREGQSEEPQNLVIPPSPPAGEPLPQDNPDNSRGKGEDYRSRVANFVQSLVHSADRLEGGIGEQVRVIAREQNEAKERVGQALEAIEKRGKVKSFLFGTDYKNIGKVRSEMVHLRNRLEQLNRLMEQVENEGEKTELQNQIRAMEQERERIESFLKQKEKQFSLFGWFLKLFNK